MVAARLRPRPVGQQLVRGGVNLPGDKANAQYARTLRAYSRRDRSVSGRPASQRSNSAGTSVSSTPSLIRRASLFVAAAEAPSSRPRARFVATIAASAVTKSS
jgi:hypothetical protein